MSKSILGVIIACKEQQPVTEEELRLTVVALSGMLTLVEQSESALADAILEDKGSAKLRAGFVQREREARFKGRKLTPAEYLGPTFTPGTPDNQAHSRMAKAIFKAATGQDL